MFVTVWTYTAIFYNSFKCTISFDYRVIRPVCHTWSWTKCWNSLVWKHLGTAQKVHLQIYTIAITHDLFCRAKCSHYVRLKQKMAIKSLQACGQRMSMGIFQKYSDHSRVMGHWFDVFFIFISNFLKSTKCIHVMVALWIMNAGSALIL